MSIIQCSANMIRLLPNGLPGVEDACWFSCYPFYCNVGNTLDMVAVVLLPLQYSRNTNTIYKKHICFGDVSMTADVFI